MRWHQVVPHEHENLRGRFLLDRDEHEVEYVPCLIINKDAAGNIENLRPLHTISREQAESGQYSLLDLVAYLRTQVRRQHNLPTPQPPQPTVFFDRTSRE